MSETCKARASDRVEKRASGKIAAPSKLQSSALQRGAEEGDGTKVRGENVD